MNNTEKYLTAELISTVLGKNIDHEDNSGILLDCGELHYFNLDGEKGSQGEHMPITIFSNKTQFYCSARGYNVSVFGCSNSPEPNDNIYEAKVIKGFNDELYKSVESSSRDEVVLECFNWMIKNTNIRDIAVKKAVA